MTPSTSNPTDRVGYALDSRFLDHRNPAGHPERPERLESVMAMLDELEGGNRWEQVCGEMVPLDLVAQVHSAVLVQALRESMGQPYTRLDADTYTCSDSFEVARLASGHGVELTRRVLAGTLAAGFALIRPPGHHAETNRIMGFCLLNNVAIAAQAALQEASVDRVAIVDFDVHHGNGTQEIFYARSDVLYISAHQHPLYPGTGALQENGRDRGLGFTINFPLPAGLGNPTYNSLFVDLVCPLVEAFEPQVILVDWRQLEFPATTNGIPRFFRADPDHEGMVKDQQVRRLVKLKKNEKTLTMAAAKAGMSRKTARKYLKSGKLPSQCQPERYWRTRSDPFESVWPEVKEILKRSPTVEAKAVFDHLCRQQEGAFQQGQLRTLQRRIKQWKAEYGEAKEVMFPQKYQPGHQAQSDFTFMGRLGVTIQGQPFPHLLYHFVLAYSNWEAATLCFSESFESLSLGLQNALWELGALPEEHRTDRLSAAVKNLKREEFTERYQALLRHFGMRSSRTQAGKAHENGDVEQSHHRLKRAIEQELLLRCSRDFSSREEYEGFVAVIVSRRNAARQKRLGEELAVMRPLPARRLDDFTRQWVRVSPSSTIRVRHNTYSVDSRLIGERVQVRVWADQVEVYYGGRRQARMPRLRGEGKHRIDYRHVIHSLVRKPGAFTRYRWREDLFPGILFRVAYDELRRDCPATADRQYLKILEVAAQEGEQRVREALQVLIERGQRIRFEALRECLVDPVVEPWEVMVEKMDVGLYDTLLENREVRS